MKVDIVLGWDGYAIARGRTEAPVVQHRDHPFVDSVSQTLEQSFFCHDSLRVNGDLHDHISLNAAGKLRTRNLQVLEGDRQGGLDFVTAAVITRAQRRTGLQRTG